MVAGGAPYVDFSIFGPHGKRMLKRLVFTAHVYEPASGSWHRQELPGPLDFQSRWKSWGVFRTATLLLGFAPVEPLDHYVSASAPTPRHTDPRSGFSAIRRM